MTVKTFYVVDNGDGTSTITRTVTDNDIVLDSYAILSAKPYHILQNTISKTFINTIRVPLTQVYQWKEINLCLVRANMINQ